MERELIIGKAVIEQIKVTGKFNANEYDANALMNLNVESLDSIYANLKSIADKQTSGSLLNKTTVSKSIEKQMELVQAIFDVKQERAKAETEAKANAKAKAEEIALLQAAKTVKKVQAVKKLSLEQIEKNLADLQA